MECTCPDHPLRPCPYRATHRVATKDGHMFNACTECTELWINGGMMWFVIPLEELDEQSITRSRSEYAGPPTRPLA